jgi:TetR/AcrR family transcriptional regulator, transcriptional repressor for nem operon
MAPDSRSRIIDAARELMLARGYSATSVDDICSSAKVSKGSFYHSFASKAELGLAVLDAFYQHGVSRLRNGDYVRNPDPVGRLMGFFDHLEVVAPELWEHGCLLGNFATELAESSPEIHARVGELFDQLVEGMTPVFEPFGDDAKALAEQLLNVLEGSIIMGRAHSDPGRIAVGVGRFRRVIEMQMDALGIEAES